MDFYELEDEESEQGQVHEQGERASDAGAVGKLLFVQ